MRHWYEYSILVRDWLAPVLLISAMGTARASPPCSTRTQLAAMLFLGGACPSPPPSPSPFVATFVRGAREPAFPTPVPPPARLCAPPDSARARRSPPTPATLCCVMASAVLLDLYRRLFGPIGDGTHFDMAVRQVLDHRPIGWTTTNQDSVPAFERTVREEHAALMSARAEGIRRFAHVSGMRAVADDAAQAGAPSSALSSASASRAERGIYRLDLHTYVPVSIVPRIRRHGSWVQADEPFSATIVDTNDRALLRRIATIADQWEQDYRDPPDDDSDTDGGADDMRGTCPVLPQGAQGASQRLASYGQSQSASIAEAARTGLYRGMLMVLVSYRDQPVALLHGGLEEPETDSTYADLSHIVSAPRNVLSPTGPDAVRGAASFALDRFLQYLRERGVMAVDAEAINERSGTLLHGNGFRLLTDLE